MKRPAVMKFNIIQCFERCIYYFSSEKGTVVNIYDIIYICIHVLHGTFC